jgi:hypothetical protein
MKTRGIPLLFHEEDRKRFAAFALFQIFIRYRFEESAPFAVVYIMKHE